MKLAAKRITSNILSFVNSRLILGVLLYLASTVIYLSALKGGQLSVLYPMVALGYIWTLLWSKLFFQESMSKAKFAGLGLIVAGVVLVGIGTGQYSRCPDQGLAATTGRRPISIACSDCDPKFVRNSVRPSAETFISRGKAPAGNRA